ncbi:hypothetical protein D3C72_2238580 [compost metagenome]
MIGQAHVQQHGVGHVALRQVQALVGGLGHQAAVAQLMGQVEQYPGKTGFILDHQDATVGERRQAPVIGEGRHRRSLVGTHGNHYRGIER